MSAEFRLCSADAQGNDLCFRVSNNADDTAKTRPIDSLVEAYGLTVRDAKGLRVLLLSLGVTEEALDTAVAAAMTGVELRKQKAELKDIKQDLHTLNEEQTQREQARGKRGPKGLS